MLVVDTNVLLYAAERSFPEHRRCRELVERWRAGGAAWHTTWHVLYEFVRVATHPRVFREPWSLGGALGFVKALLASPSLSVLVETERHDAVLAEVAGDLPEARGNFVHDLRTAVLMREHGVRRIYTRDMDFHRFSFVEVVDPLH